MKKIYLFIILTISPLALIYGQDDCNELKVENEKLKVENSILKNKAEFCDLYQKSNNYVVKSFNDNFVFNVLKVIGNKNEQTVEIHFTLKHKLPNQNLTFDARSNIAYDEMGNSYKSKSIEFSGNSSSSYVYADLPTNQIINGKFMIRNVLPNIDRFKKVIGKISTKNKDGGDNKSSGDFELINTVINWQ